MALLTGKPPSGGFPCLLVHALLMREQNIALELIHGYTRNWLISGKWFKPFPLSTNPFPIPRLKSWAIQPKYSTIGYYELAHIYVYPPEMFFLIVKILIHPTPLTFQHPKQRFYQQNLHKKKILYYF